MNPPPNHELNDHALALRRFTRALCRGDHEADDVYQDVMLAAVERGAGAGPWADWLRAAGRNIARARRRGEGRRREREHDSVRVGTVPSAAERAARLELDERLIEHVRRLPDTQSEAVFLRYWEGLAPREIAQRLGVSTETAKTRLKRGLETLRVRLDADAPGGREQWTAALGFVSGSIVMKKSIVGMTLAVVAMGAWAAWPDADVIVQGPGPEVVTADVPELVLAQPAAASSSRMPVGIEEEIALPPGCSVIVVHIMDEAHRAMKLGVAASENVWVTRWSPGVLGSPGAPSGNRTRVRMDASRAFRYVIEHDWTGEQTFRVQAGASGGLRSVFKDVVIVDREPRLVRVAFTRTPHDDLIGTVVDLGGEPVAGAEVTVGGSRSSVPPVLSDEAGVFRVPNLPARNSGGTLLRASLAGWCTVHATTIDANEQGAWGPATIVLARSSVMRVRVEDADGRAIEGLAVHLRVSPAERLGDEYNYRWILPDQHSATGSDGIALFSKAPADIKLRVNVSHRSGAFTFDREHDGSAVFDSEERPSRVITNRPGEERTVTIRLAFVRRIAGHVVDEDGTPLAGAYVGLRSAERHLGKASSVSAFVKSDGDGTFAFDVAVLEAPSRLRLNASNSSSQMVDGPLPDASLAGSLLVDLSQDTEALTIVVSPTLTITGEVVVAGDERRWARIRVTPVGGSDIPGMLDGGFADTWPTEQDGSFTLAGLSEGAYDVLVQHPRHAPVLIEGVRAGTRGLVVRLDDPPEATIEIEVVAPGCEVDELIVLHGALRVWSGRSVTARVLSPVESISHPAGWPERALGLWSGGRPVKFDYGSCVYKLSPIEGDAVSMEVAAGLHWFGAKGRTVQGDLLFPIGTGLVEVTPGVHRLRFELRRIGGLTGRVAGIPAGDEWCVALALPGGDLIALDTRRQTMETTAELGFGATFVLESAPVGEFELRAAPRAELLAGRYRLATTVVIRAGETTRVVLGDQGD